MTDEGETNTAEKLMGALISKMETMDNSIQLIKAENKQLKSMLNNPMTLLKKAGFVRASNSAPEDLMPDEFRGNSDEMIIKGEDGHEISVPTNNADFHTMEWADIHALADKAKSVGAIGNNIGMD